MTSVSDLVLLEMMPQCYRESHRQACGGSWGEWPYNGAERCLLTREDAETVVASDPDEYNHIVRNASPSDLLDYERKSLDEVTG